MDRPVLRGLNLGYAWHDIAGIYDSAGTPTDLSGTEPNGAIVGAQLGYNWRMNWFLLGVELDADAGTNSKSVVDPANSEQITGDLSYLASARARLGVLWYDVLFYGTGGVGAARYTFSESIKGNEQRLKDTGWVYGGGLEWMVRLRRVVAHRVTGAGDFVRFHDIDVVRAGVSVRLAP